MAQTTCCVPGCDRRATSVGMCGSHRHRVRRYGDPQAHIPIGYTSGRVLTLPLSETGGTGRPIYEDHTWCRIAFFDRMLSLREMADEAGCALRTVARWMDRHGLDLPTAPERREMRGNTLRGARSPRWSGAGVCSCGNRKTSAASGCSDCRDVTGERNPKWRGDQVGYPGAHDRVKALWGLALSHACRHCLGPAAHWAYDHLDPDERVDPEEGPYSPDPDHYLPLCARCHKAFDMGYLRRKRRQEGSAS